MLYAPNYLGCDGYEARVWPTLNVSYGDRSYFNICDGLGWNMIRHGNCHLSSFIGYTPGCDNVQPLTSAHASIRESGKQYASVFFI
ncbi:MipA/OmpV family protein [Halovibrio salipaludis]|uniref:MipA/OmpV family protein n=1 Tax=Halovibrio salipaludis TaxID=2032626 RepID=UPI0018E9594A